MSLTIDYPHILKDFGEPARLESHPRTRVSMIVTDYFWRGWSAEEIVRQYSYLTLAEVHAALAYYFDHQEEIDEELLAEHRNVSQWKKANPTGFALKKLTQERRQ